MNSTFPEIPRLYTALAEWLACMVYIWPLRKQLTGRGLIALAGVFFILQSSILMLTRDLPILF